MAIPLGAARHRAPARHAGKLCGRVRRTFTAPRFHYSFAQQQKCEGWMEDIGPDAIHGIATSPILLVMSLVTVSIGLSWVMDLVF